MSSKLVENVLALAEEKFEQGKYYEASQLYIGAEKRLVQSKKYEEAIKLVNKGLEQMLQHKQPNNALDLAQVLLDLIKLADLSHDQGLEILLAHLPLFPAELAKSNLMKAVLRWSKQSQEKEGKIANGDAKLHHVSAVNGWMTGGYEFALNHFIFSEKPDELADLLIEWASSSFSDQQDICLAHAILLLLGEENLLEANYVFKKFTSREYSSEESKTPVIRFLEYLLLTLERDASPLFLQLLTRYKSALNNDYFDLIRELNVIGDKFYGIKQQDNIFGSLLKSFFN